MHGSTAVAARLDIPIHLPPTLIDDFEGFEGIFVFSPHASFRIELGKVQFSSFHETKSPSRVFCVLCLQRKSLLSPNPWIGCALSHHYYYYYAGRPGGSVGNLEAFRRLGRELELR